MIKDVSGTSNFGVMIVKITNEENFQLADYLLLTFRFLISR
jgi:hypothetical protein